MDLNKKIRDSSEFSQHSANPEERFLVGMFSQITERLKQKYNYSSEELLNLGSNDLLVPVSVFAGKLSPAEALTKFLKENNDLTHHEISGLIGRDERSCWANYRRAAKKMPSPFDAVSGISVPVSIFNSEKSILEALISYLKKKNAQQEDCAIAQQKSCKHLDGLQQGKEKGEWKKVI